MKIKCGIIYNALQTVIEIAEKPMKVSLAAKFLRLLDDLQKEANFIEKQRRDIIDKYAQKDKDGNFIIENNNIKLQPNNIKLAQNELNELSEVEIEISDRMITEEDLDNSNLQLTVNQLRKIENFLHKNE